MCDEGETADRADAVRTESQKMESRAGETALDGSARSIIVLIVVGMLVGVLSGTFGIGVPAIIMVIIQQTMLIGIGMIGGTWSEFGLYKKLIPPGRRRMSTLPVVAGKAFVYASIYAVTLFYILGLHYKLFHFPTNGHTADIIAFLIPYLLSCIFLGIAVSTLFQRREQSIMLLLWCSIPALMLSGASVPREAMPEWLYRFGQILPSSSGVEGFIRLQSMGASFSDVLHEVRILWILTIVYGGFAAVGIHLRLKKAAGK